MRWPRRRRAGSTGSSRLEGQQGDDPQPRASSGIASGTAPYVPPEPAAAQHLPAAFLDDTGYKHRVVADPTLIPAPATFRMLFWNPAKLRDYLVALPVAPHAVTILQQPIGDGRGELPCDWSVFIGAEHPCVASSPGDHPCPDGLHYDEADITHCVTEQFIAAGQLGARTYRLSAYAHRRVLGSVKYQHHPNRIEIDFIEVRWDHRRQGVATGLLDELQRRRPGLPLTTGGFTEEGQKLAAAYPTKIQDEYPWRQGTTH